MAINKNKAKKALANINKFAKINQMKNREWYSIQSLHGNANWAIFFILLASREFGKSYAVMEYFLRERHIKNNPFYWIRLTKESRIRMLKDNAKEFVDADLRRKYNLELTVRGRDVYDHGHKMASIYDLSTAAKDKGVALFDKDFLKKPNMKYLICMDEFQEEKGERKTMNDIVYNFLMQMENLVRSTKEAGKIKIFLVANMLEDASDILTCFNFIPMQFGRFKLKSRKCVIDYPEPTEAYKERRKGSISDLLLGNDVSNYTNKMNSDTSILYTGVLRKPTGVIKFTKDLKFTIRDSYIISEYKNENKPITAMRPYIDETFIPKNRDEVISNFDTRTYLYRNMITFKRFQKAIMDVKPRK